MKIKKEKRKKIQMITNKKYTKEEIADMKLWIIHELTAEYTRDKDIIDICDRMAWKQKQRVIDNFMGHREEEE